jgi:hypothetical protein
MSYVQFSRQKKEIIVTKEGSSGQGLSCYETGCYPMIPGGESMPANEEETKTRIKEIGIMMQGNKSKRGVWLVLLLFSSLSSLSTLLLLSFIQMCCAIFAEASSVRNF